MKNYIYILLFVLGSSISVEAQCSCDIVLTQDLTTQDSCCYYVTAIIDQVNNGCQGIVFSNMDIYTNNGPSNPCEILSINPLNGTSVNITNSANTTGNIIAPSGGWNLAVPTNVAEICFTNGVLPLSLVAINWEGIGAGGVVEVSCPLYQEVVTCPSGPLDCSCMIDFQATNDPCCYDVGVEFVGMDCDSLSYTSLEINSSVIPAYACDISLVVPSPGYSFNQSSNTFVTITSSTNMANTNAHRIIAQVCFSDPVSNFGSAINAYMSDQSGSAIFCDENIEIDIPCVTPPDPKPLEKLVGDTMLNAPLKVIYSGQNKMAILGYHTEPGSNNTLVEYGTIKQIDLVTHTIDYITKSPPNVIFTDMAYNRNSGEIMIVGHTAPWYGSDSKSLIVKITSDDNGVCDKIQYYDHPGVSERFLGIIQVDGPNPDFYVYGSSQNLSGSTYITTIFKMDDNCTPYWYYDFPAMQEEVNGGIFSAQNNGVTVVGKDKFITLGSNGIKTNEGWLNNYKQLYDGYTLPNGDKLLIGGENINGGAIITLWDNNNNFLDGKIFNDIKRLTSLTTDNSLFYAAGTAPGNWFSGESVILRFKVANRQIFMDGKFKVDDGETNFTPPDIAWHKDADFILYVDGRNKRGMPNDLDEFIAAYDKPLVPKDCFIELPINDQPYIDNMTNPMFSQNGNTLPMFTAGTMCSQIDYECTEYCKIIEPPCEADFTWAQIDCHKVQFTSTSTGPGPFTYKWIFNGGSIPQSTLQNPIYDFGVPGTYNVCLEIIASDGCLSTICKNVIVVAETTLPNITCVGNISVNIPACERGKVVTFSMPSVSDDCSNVSVTCTHQSGDFFPCGNTTVTCTATDTYGNTSTCSFNINVNCLCAQTNDRNIECSPVPDQFLIDFEVEDISGASSCTANVSLPSWLGTLTTINHFWSGSKLYFTGTVDAVTCPFPTGFSIQVDLTCLCPDGAPHSCTHYVNYTTPCCKEANMSPSGLCKEVDEELIDIDFFGTVKDIVQIDYYVENGPCPISSWNVIPYQTSLGYQPLRILPRYHTSDVCITAVVTLGVDELPCTVLTTDTISYTLCSGYSCSLNNQEFCYTGIPINPSPIVYSGTLPDCDYIIEWFYPNGNPFPTPNNQTISIQSTPLIYNGPPGECYKDFTYEMRISGECPTVSCYSTIRLWNDDADVGTLYLDPIENLPLCPGEDASIRYDEQCSDPTNKWTWLESLDGSVFTPIPTAGDGNPYYNTNRLFQDHWYQVERKNGLCPEKTIDIFIPVKDPFALTSFTAVPLNACRDNGLKLNVIGTNCISSINAVCDCSFTIELYKNGLLIGSIQSTQPTTGYTYIDAALNGDYSGIYYVEVIDNCCGQRERSNTVKIRPPIRLGIVGPCYICVPGTQITLMGLVKNGPADGPCTYQWYYDNGTTGYQIWGGGTGLSIQTTKAGKYKLEMTCTLGSTTCTKIAEFEVMDCFPVGVLDNEIENFDFTIAPNPSFENTQIIFDGQLYDEDQLMIYNTIGAKVQEKPLYNNQTRIVIDDLSPGTYMIVVRTKDRGTLTKRLIML